MPIARDGRGGRTRATSQRRAGSRDQTHDEREELARVSHAHGNVLSSCAATPLLVGPGRADDAATARRPALDSGHARS